MIAIPAVDVKGGRCVQLVGGRPEDERISLPDPAAVARDWFDRGFARLHVVDLDGARDGRPGNVAAIEGILQRTGLAVQVGGGIRDEAAAARWFEAGASRVVFGTAAVKNPELVRKVAAEHPGGVVVAIDARGGEVAVEGSLRVLRRTGPGI